MALHCPECGFANPEGANYCQKCGAYLGGPAESGAGEGGEDPTTMTYRVDETGEMQPVDIDEVVEESGAALVIRSGGGRAGESFSIAEERVSIGRSPDAGVFLDDVTVSRNHALLVRRRDGLYIDDLDVAGLVDLVGRGRDPRWRLGLRQKRTAALAVGGAVVVCKTALGAMLGHVGWAYPVSSGTIRPARMSVSCCTSEPEITSSPSSSLRRRRLTSSARRMSILPCRIRRW